MGCAMELKGHTRKRSNPASKSKSTGLKTRAYQYRLLHNRRGAKPPLHQDGGRGDLRFEGYDNIGRFVAIECKRPSGGRLSPAQKERIADINRKGGVAFVAHSGEEALQKLKENHCI